MTEVEDGEDRVVSAALDELYGVDPNEFVALRKRLVAELRAAGDNDAAQMVGAARRPTTAAWAMNQLARREHDVLATFLARSRDLAAAQDAALAGDRDSLRNATRAHREAASDALEAAVAFLGPGASEAIRTQILVTLQSATHDPATADALRVGRLIREVNVSSGFTGDVGVSEIVSRAAVKPRSKPQLRVLADESEDRRRRAEREAALAKAASDLDDAGSALAEAERALASAEGRVATLSDELARAQRARRDATATLRGARNAVAVLTKALDRLRRETE